VAALNADSLAERQHARPLACVRSTPRIVGSQTWASLTGNIAFGSTVRRGDTGECVKAAQNELDRHTTQ
jgi:hypothetical protein